MALSDKDIIITPNRGQTADPVIAFSGASASLGPQTISLRVYPTSNGTLSFEGSAGQLFSITNDLTGSIFSVNDVSGIPSIDVNADGTILIAPYNGKVGIGTASPFTNTTTFTNTRDPVISQDGGYFGGGLYYDGAWRNTVASQGGWAIRNSGGVIAFFTGPANGAVGSTIAASERMRIDSSGNVGIGKTPTTTLDVNGTINATQYSINSVKVIDDISSGHEFYNSSGTLGLRLAGTTTVAATVYGAWTLASGATLEASYAADLAEYYEGDMTYEVGTVMVVGGDKEVTACATENAHNVVGVVSNNAAYIMNGACPGEKNLIALRGRVPVKVVGNVKKGDRLIASGIEGHATVNNDRNAWSFAIALEDGDQLVEAVIL